MICNQLTGELVNRAEQIMDLVPKEKKERFSFELLLSEIEVNTSVCNNVSMALDELASLRNFLRVLGEKLDYKIAISGTHPTALPENQEFVQNESYDWVSSQLHYYARQNITFATHIHIAVPDAEAAIHVTNSLRQWVAPLLALSANSPFYGGEYTSFKSARTMQFGIFPRTNIPPFFKSFSDYIDTINLYKDIDSIKKSRQIWWKLRPHLDFGTIEFRMLDAQRSLKRTEMFIAIAQALVFQGVEDYNNNNLNESFSSEFLSDSVWKASRFDLSSKIVDVASKDIITIEDKINEMVDYIKPALDKFNTIHVLKELDNILENGTEGDSQIIEFEKNGFKGLKYFLMNEVEYSVK